MDGKGIAPKKELRDYQEKALQAVNDRFAAGIRKQLLSAATGSGKTEMFAFLIKQKLENRESSLVLAHRERLVIQAADRIKGIVGPMKVGIVNGAKKDWWSPCVVATVQSASTDKQLSRAPKFQNIIIDEAHRSNSGSYLKVVEKLLSPGGLLLGVTATPNRTDKKGLIPAVFEELVYEVGMKELIEKDHLSAVIGKEIRLPIDFNSLKTSVSTDGIRDYRPEEVQAAFEEAEWMERITEGWKEVASDRRTIVFVPPGVVDGRGCGMAHSLAEYMALQGIRAAAVDGTTPQGQQDRIIGDFTDGRLQVLVNVNIFTEGLDIPPIDCVLFARPTQSSIIYSQAVGRGTRKFPGKENCLVIDVTGITEQLADNGQSLMGLGKILPTEEQERNEKLERIKAAKRLIKKLWLKGINVSLVDGLIKIDGEIGPRDQKKVDEYSDEVRQVLEEKLLEQDNLAPGERRPPNTSLLSSDELEIRDINLAGGDFDFNWTIDAVNKRATLRAEGIGYEIKKVNEMYEYEDTENSIAGTVETWAQAKLAVELRIKTLRVRRRRRLDDPNAAWKQKPVTEKQIGLMRKFLIPIPAGCTSGQASVMIQRVFDRKKNKQRA